MDYINLIGGIMQMEKIVIVCCFDIKKMLTQRIHHLINFLSKKNVEVIVIYKGNSIQEVIDQQGNITYIALALEFVTMSRVIKYDKEYLKDILDKYFPFEIDIAYFNLPYSISLVDYFKDKCKVLVYDDVDYYSGYFSSEDYLSQSLFACEKYCIENVDIVINVSNGLKERRILEGFKNDSMFVIENGAHTHLYDTTVEKYENKMIYSGAIEINKGFNIALEGIKLLNEYGHYLELDVFGDGSYKEELIKRVTDLGLEEQIKIYTPITHEKLRRIMSKYKFGLLTVDYSIAYESASPIKLFEYMASGVITIGSDFGQIKEIINQHDVGITVKDGKTFASELSKLMTNKTRMESIKNNAIKASRNYSWDKLFEKLFDTIKERFSVTDENTKLKRIKLITELDNKYIFKVTKEINEIEKFYLDKIEKILNQCEERGCTRLYLYGAGEHTAMLLRYMKQFGPSKIIGLIDKNTQLQGQEQFGYKVFSFEECIDTCDAIIISSYAYEQEIYNQIIQTCVTNNIYLQGIYNDFN